MSGRIYNKNLTRIDLRFGRITPDEARARQYELLKDGRIWRAFINGYARSGFVVFDEEALSREKILETLKELNAKVVAEKKLTVGELIESSYSWNNVLERS